MFSNNDSKLIEGLHYCTKLLTIIIENVRFEPSIIQSFKVKFSCFYLLWMCTEMVSI